MAIDNNKNPTDNKYTGILSNYQDKQADTEPKLPLETGFDNQIEAPDQPSQDFSNLESKIAPEQHLPDSSSQTLPSEAPVDTQPTIEPENKSLPPQLSPKPASVAVPDEPQIPIQPEAPVVLEAPVAVETPETPVVPETPAVTETPVTPEVSNNVQVSETDAANVVPESSETPVVTEITEVTEKPSEPIETNPVEEKIIPVDTPVESAPEVEPVAPVVTPPSPDASSISLEQIIKGQRPEVGTLEDNLAPVVSTTEMKPKHSVFRIIFLFSLFIFLGVSAAVAYYLFKSSGNTLPSILNKSTTPSSDVQNTNTDSTSSICQLNDKTYQINEQFPSADGCNTCSCNADLTITCTEKACITPSPTSSTSAQPTIINSPSSTSSSSAN